MKKHSLMLCIFLLVACFLFSGCENTLTETSTPNVSESVEFTENEEDESSEGKVPGDEENDEDDHGASETDNDEPTPFFENEEDDFDEEWEKISEEDEDEDEDEDEEENDEDDEDLYSEDDENEDEENADNEKEEIHASASSPRRFSHEQRMQLIDDKLKENGTEEYHIFDAVRLIFEEEVLTGFCNESGDCNFDIKLGTEDFSLEQGNVILIWDLSKKYFYQKEILLVTEVEEDEGISHITAKEGDQSYIFHDTTFRAKAMNLTPEENLLIFQEQIDSIEQKRGIIDDDEKELLEYLHADLEREKQQYEREQQEKQQEQQEISNESQDEKQENTKEEKQEKLQEESQEKEEKSDSSEVVQRDEGISSISSSEKNSQKETKTTSKESQTKPQKKSEPSQEIKQETTVSTPNTPTSTTTKPTGKEKLYKVCGTFSFGKMYSYYLCEIDDLDKQKEVFSKKLGDLANLEDFSDFFYIKADIQGDELLYRTIIDRFTEKDLGQLTQEQFDKTFDFVNTNYHHTVSYKDEIRLSKLKEGETYTFKFDPQNGESTKPKINNDTSNNVLVFTYSEGNLGGYEINLYPSYTFPDIPHYAFSSEDEKKYYLTFKTISSEDFVKYAKTENIAFLSQEKLNTELERDKSYFYNDTNQTFTLFVKNSPYTNMPGTEGTRKEIKPGQIFGGPHAINTFTIITNDGSKNPLETTKVTSTEKKNPENPERKITTSSQTTQTTQTTSTQGKENKSDPSSKYPFTKVMKPGEIYKDDFLGVQVKNKSSKYQGFVEIVKDTEGDDMLNASEKYLVMLYHFVPETYENFELINPEDAKDLATEKGYPQDFLVRFQTLCFSRRTCFNPGTMFAGGEIVLNRKGFNMETFGGRQDNFYSDNIFFDAYNSSPESYSLITNYSKEKETAAYKKYSNNKYQSFEDYEKKLHQFESQFTFAIKSDIVTTKEVKEETPIKTTSVTPENQKKPQTEVQTVSAEVIKKEIKSDPTFYTKNLGQYPSQGLKIDAKGDLIDPQQTKEIMQKLGFCGEETAFACAQGVKRFEKEKVGKLFIYSVGTWSRENNCKGKGKATCYTPEGTTPFFTTKPSTKEGFVYLYPAKNVKLCILEGNATTC